MALRKLKKTSQKIYPKFSLEVQRHDNKSMD